MFVNTKHKGKNSSLKFLSLLIMNCTETVLLYQFLYICKFCFLIKMIFYDARRIPWAQEFQE